MVVCITVMSACEKEAIGYQCDNLCIQKGQKVSILGDSYSTFEGYVDPETNACYYPRSNVSSVEQMWWHLFISKHGLILEKNNSYSGSTICRREKAPGTSYIERAENLGHPDLIFIFGGTNDSWQSLPLGDYQYENLEDKNLYQFKPAFSYLLRILKGLYPQSTIINLINPNIKAEYKTAMTEITQYYDVCNIVLGDFNQTNGHPTLNGMESIETQISKIVR